MKLIWIGCFGMLGVFARYFVDLAAARVATPFPVGTLAINVLGSFFAGWVFVAGLDGARTVLTPDLKTGLLIGFMGGFTTFSAYCLQSALLIREGGLTWAAVYLVLSPALGVSASLAGIAIGTRSEHT